MEQNANTQKQPVGGPAKAPVKKPVKRGRILRMKRGPLRNLVILVIVLVVFFGLGSVISRIWTNYLWFGELGQTGVFWTPFLARLCVGVVFALIFFGILYGNLYLARKISPRLLPARGVNADDNVLEFRVPRKWFGLIVLFAAILLAIFVGLGYSGRWQTILLFLHRNPFGYADPLFNKDASFFVFTLPVWKLLVDFVGVTMLLSFIGTVAVYVIDRALVLNSKNRLSLAPHVKAHLSVLLAIAMVAKAGDYMLQTWELDYSMRGTVLGASYTDVHASLPVLHFLAIVSLVAAVIFLANIRYKGWRLPAIAIAVMFLTWALAGKAYPAIVQQYRVSPNEISVEQPYIANNIEATRFAFGIDKVTTVANPATTDLTPAAIQADKATLQNVRLWEPRPALDTYRQIQAIGSYYVFTDVDVDRYTIDGEYRQALISARELDQARLKSRTWQNLHLIYTHGYGFVLSPVNEAGGDGLPQLLVKNIPTQNETDLKITRPQLYYSEVGNDYIIVKSTNREIDYQNGSTSVTVTYDGSGGVPVGNWVKRLAFSFRFGTPSILFSKSLTADSRIMFRRTIKERVESLAPFLTYDYDPYLVLRDDGSLVWMWDAYTTTHRFPYSQKHENGYNYIRNPIKVIIDAYTGKVTFYQIDAKDPLTNAWGAIFPGLFTPGDQMPADLRRHMRYPENYFSAQADMLATYHMTDPVVFYNKEDVWEIPTEVYANATEPVQTEPYYQMLALPGETEAESALLLPFSPFNKQNMASLLVGRQDGDNYGKLLTVDFPKDKLVFGPAQIEARIDNAPEISSQLTLWSQGGSTVIRGNLLVVPVADSVMYFEPLYLQAQKNSIPQLTRVIVAYGDRVVMEPTLSDGLVKIFGADAAIGSTTTVPGGTTTTTSGATTSTTVPPSSTTTSSSTTSTTSTTGTTVTTLPTDIAALIATASSLYEQALAAQRAGDWARYGQLIGQLGEVLAALEAAERAQ